MRAEAGSSAARIVYLSRPDRVSMGDAWFEIANPSHFWFQRRFEVLIALAAPRIIGAKTLAEFGAGNGVLQKQIETRFARATDGFDLNELPLRQNISASPLFCYDIHQRNPELAARYDLLFLFDVLEHIDDEDGFLASVLYHIKPGGYLCINVPALQSLYSRYDKAVGHVRRYDLPQLRQVGLRNGLEIEAATYWGLPLMPLLWIRRFWIRNTSEDQIIAQGMDSRTGALNSLLRLWSRLEWLPQQTTGTSLMMLLRKP